MRPPAGSDTTSRLSMEMRNSVYSVLRDALQGAGRKRNESSCQRPCLSILASMVETLGKYFCKGKKGIEETRMEREEEGRK